MLNRVSEQARQRALKSLGLAEVQGGLEAVRKEQEKLGTREDALKSQLIARVRGVPVSQVGSTYLCDTEVSNAIKTRVEVHEEQSMMQSDLGRRIVDLRREKDNLLDVVWLATSSVQIKELRGKVAELLGDETTRLEREAMVIAPVVD